MTAKPAFQDDQDIFGNSTTPPAIKLTAAQAKALDIAKGELKALQKAENNVTKAKDDLNPYFCPNCFKACFTQEENPELSSCCSTTVVSKEEVLAEIVKAKLVKVHLIKAINTGKINPEKTTKAKTPKTPKAAKTETSKAPEVTTPTANTETTYLFFANTFKVFSTQKKARKFLREHGLSITQATKDEVLPTATDPAILARNITFLQELLTKVTPTSSTEATAE